jgi:hypothetical protein
MRQKKRSANENYVRAQGIPRRLTKREVVAVAVSAVALPAISLVPLGGCGEDPIVYIDTWVRDDAGKDADADAGTDGDAEPEEGPPCTGRCVPMAPYEWLGPALVWVGPPDEAPACPDERWGVVYQGFSGPSEAPLFCPLCACDPPEEASCALPVDWTVADAAVCMPPADAQVTSFAAPAGWDGACTTEHAIPAGQLCGGHPCVQSLSIPAPGVTTGACTPREERDPPVPSVVPWTVTALACAPNAHASCNRDGRLCVPEPAGRLPPPDGFRTCIYHPDEVPCPEAYPVQRVFYSGVEDTRACSPCACGEPEGASCTILATAYNDDACQGLVVSSMVSSVIDFCGVLVPGTGLGSKSAEVLDIDPGTCTPSGGAPTGGVKPTGPSTFCCLP